MRSPVALLIFNRPETTARVLAEIARARPPKLLVVADGPRTDHPEDAARCAAARALVAQADWPCEVLTHYAEANLGCGRRISSGLDWVFAQVPEAVILEDDCVPHPSFFPFCDALLERYRDDERVMMVGGTNHLLKLDIPESYVFSHNYAVWGWASWRRAWRYYDVGMKDWPALRAQRVLEYIYPQRHVAEYFTAAFDAAYTHRIDTWDYQWTYCCLSNSGLSAIPSVNLVSNIGYSGTHVAASDASSPNFAMPTYALDVENLHHPQWVLANHAYDRALFARALGASPMRRIRSRLASLRRRLWPR